MKKIFVIDTNVLLHDPRSLFAFENNEVVIPLVVLDELDKKKVGGHDETADIQGWLLGLWIKCVQRAVFIKELKPQKED